MNNKSTSIPEPIDTSVCDVCKGMFKDEDARGFFLKPRKDHAVYDPPYVYTYIHHAHIVALRASAEAGCCLCAFLFNKLGEASEDCDWGRDSDIECDGDSDIEWVLDSDIISKLMPPNSERTIAQPDEDVFIATQLAELGRRQGIYDTWELGAHGHGRIVVQFSVTRPRPWWEDGTFDADVTVLGSCLQTAISYFPNPCMSGHSRKVFSLLELLLIKRR